MGDMNIDLSKLSQNAEIELYYNTLLCHNLESHINSPTRIQYNKNTNKICSATIIDHIFSNLTEFSYNNNMYFIYKILEQGVQTSKIYDPSC